MMKRTILLTVCFFSALLLQAQQALELDAWRPSTDTGNAGATSLVLSLSADSGVLFGMIHEWVYVDHDNNGVYNNVLSRLDWQQNPLFYAGVTGTVTIADLVCIAGGVWLGIPGRTGYMEDNDWDWTSSHGDYSVYSISDNNLRGAIFTDLNVGIALIRENTLAANLLIGYSFRQFDMYSTDSWVELPPGSVPYLVSGTTIDYQLNISQFYLGLETAWAPLPWFSADFMLTVSPFLTFAYARDRHYAPPGYYQDLPVFGWTVTAVPALSFHLSPEWSLRVKTILIWSPPYQGLTYVNRYEALGNRGGSSLLLGGLSASLTFTMGRTQTPSTPNE